MERDKKKRTKFIKISSQLPASADNVFELIQDIETLNYIASPFAQFKIVGETDPQLKVGETFKFKLKVHKILPVGVHTIEVKEFDKGNIYTHEHNKKVPIWNHRIVIEPMNKSSCRYTDEVEIGAGLKTSLICWWSKKFYKHRQKKWKKLIYIKVDNEKELFQ